LRRYRFIFEGVFTTPSVILTDASKSREEFKRCRNTARVLTQNGESILAIVTDRWNPPPHGAIKLNWDEFFGARSIHFQLQVAPKMVETMAAYYAVQFCREVGFFDVILEGDASQVVQEINQNSPNYTTAGHFIESIQHDIIFFRATKFVQVLRICNKVTHELAREAIRNKVECVWLEEISPSVFFIVCRELSGHQTLYWSH
jgi:hypothetical protein